VTTKILSVSLMVLQTSVNSRSVPGAPEELLPIYLFKIWKTFINFKHPAVFF